MFDLKDMPNSDTLSEFALKYKNPDVAGLQSWLYMARTCSDMMAAFEANLSRHGLSQTKFFVLLLLKRHPDGLGVGRLAEGTGVSSPTMTGIVDRLEQAGLCQRVADAEDRRAWVIRLLPDGDRLLGEALPDHYRWVAELMSHFGEDERVQLSALMLKLNHALDGMDTARKGVFLK
ncbi:MarR family winged helix-turn-helix transcriptional regulator [Burkholderia anthina]|uniref:MarR family winged helix-turn-helix transcriptional regulator n=1 Tax=Burkholderia anthina TaxID=179879 RepID=UPI0015894598|nr:MarR family transcriptional regulator [Burkholderia anthina]